LEPVRKTPRRHSLVNFGDLPYLWCRLYTLHVGLCGVKGCRLIAGILPPDGVSGTNSEHEHVVTNPWLTPDTNTDVEIDGVRSPRNGVFAEWMWGLSRRVIELAMRLIWRNTSMCALPMCRDACL
jgi:hypothetical protein